MTSNLPLSGARAWSDGSGRAVAVLRGVVEHGDARGRTLGFPTANLTCLDVPVADGVWAGVAEVRGRQLVAAVSIGRRQTFYGGSGARLVEVHLVDFHGDVYGDELTVALHRRLRGQRRFGSIAELVDQLRQDVARTRDWAQRHRRPAKGAAGPAAVGEGGVPGWAMRRTEGVLRSRGAASPLDPGALARLAGISKSLARRCLAAHGAAAAPPAPGNR